MAAAGAAGAAALATGEPGVEAGVENAEPAVCLSVAAEPLLFGAPTAEDFGAVLSALNRDDPAQQRVCIQLCRTLGLL